MLNTTDAALDCKNDLVSSQNAISTKGLIIIWFLKVLANLARRFPVLLLWDVSSGSQIPDLNFFHPRSQILDPNFFHLGSLIPDPGSQILIKEFKYFNPKKWFLSSQKWDPCFPSWIRIPDPDPDILPIPDPNPGSQILNPMVQNAQGSLIPDPDSQHCRFWICSGWRG